MGNASRTRPGIHGPGHISFDLVVARNRHFLERYRLQFRWEMFNFTNTPQWGLPNQSFGSSNFGRLTGAGRCGGSQGCRASRESAPWMESLPAQRRSRGPAPMQGDETEEPVACPGFPAKKRGRENPANRLISLQLDPNWVRFASFFAPAGSSPGPQSFQRQGKQLFPLSKTKGTNRQSDQGRSHARAFPCNLGR